jgi:1-phosphofructokinase family hexose kinase
VILAAGLTPAWQQIMRFERLLPGEVNRALEARWCASGKVLNVGIALAHLHVPAITLAPLGGQAREPVDREFAAFGADAHWIDVAHPTRVCTTALDLATNRATELVENAGPMTSAELAQFAHAFGELAAGAQVAILTGSLPDSAPANLYHDLLGAVNCPVLLDVRGPELLAALPRRPFLAKPNREELARTLAQDLSDDASLLQAMRKLNERGAEWVLVTSGARPAWVAHGGCCWRIEACPVTAVNPIGSGDCLAAGIAWGLTRGEAPLDAIRLGIAAAAENVGQLLPGRIDPARVLQRRDAVSMAVV